MNEKLLTISEAAKLLDVCENTLRDWDIEKKLVATRTDGGHRRYSLDQIREFLEKNPIPIISHVDEEDKKLLFEMMNDKDKFYQLLLDKWEKHLTDVDSKDKKALVVILENVEAANSAFPSEVLSTDQLIYITKYGWLRCRFKKMVAIQPMTGPANLVYKLVKSKNGLIIDSEAVAAKSKVFDSFTIFTDADFETVKDLYANSIARELEYEIMSKLPTSQEIDNLDRIPNHFLSSTQFDYIIAPKAIIKKIKNNPKFEKIDLYEIPSFLNAETFAPMQTIGKYVDSNITESPIFCPYVLVSVVGNMACGNSKVLTRYGWLIP